MARICAVNGGSKRGERERERESKGLMRSEEEQVIGKQGSKEGR